MGFYKFHKEKAQAKEKYKFRKDEYLSSEIGLNKNKLKIRKLNCFKESNDPSPKMLKE